MSESRVTMEMEVNGASKQKVPSYLPSLIVTSHILEICHHDFVVNELFFSLQVRADSCTVPLSVSTTFTTR